MQLSGQNLSLLKNSIEFNNGEVDSGKKEDLKGIFAKKEAANTEKDSVAFVQTNKENRTSKVPGIKIQLGKTLSDTVIVSKSLNMMKENFQNIDRALNIESESEVRLPAERKEQINNNVSGIKTVINETRVGEKKIFLSNFKINVRLEAGSQEKYKARIDFNKEFKDLDLDFDQVETNLDKRFYQIREVNKNISKLESIKAEVDSHTNVLKRQMDKYETYGKEATLFHLNSRLEDSNLVNQIKIKTSIFADHKSLAIVQSNSNSAAVLNLLP